MSKTDRDSAVMEAFYQSASAMMQQAMKRRLGFTCTIDPAKQQAHAKLTDRGETLTETNASVWRQLGLFEVKPETKTTRAPKGDRRVWIRASQWDELDAATQAELTEPLTGSSIEWEGRENAITAVIPGDVLVALAQLAAHLAVDLFYGDTPPPPEAPEAPEPEPPKPPAKPSRKARAESPVAYVAQYFGRMTEFDELPVKALRALREPLPGHRLEWSEIEVKDTPSSPARTVARCTSEEKDALEKFIRRHHVRGITFRAVKTEGATT